jgi:hypothetical protein
MKGVVDGFGSFDSGFSFDVDGVQRFRDLSNSFPGVCFVVGFDDNP